MNFQNKDKKKILRIGIASVVCVCIVGGGTLFAMKKSEKAVKVAPVAGMSNGGWYSESDVYDYAKVSAGASQDIYQDDTLTIKEIYVKAGDTVKIGDRLVAYDTTLAGLEREMKQMEIQGIELNIQNQKAELEQLRNARIIASAGRNQEELQKMTAKGTRPGAVQLASVKGQQETENGEGLGNPEQPETPGNPGTTETPEEPAKPAIGKPFPEELKGKTIYKEITKDAIPYNEDGDGTKEKPYRYLCAPGATVNAEFMLKMLEERAVCVFDVVDQEQEPTLLLYSWTLDGKTGQVIKPEEPETPDTPEEPEIPEEPEAPGGYDEPDTGDADGMTREEQTKQIQEKEQKIKDLDLEKRTAQLELKKLDKKVNNGVVKSTVEGTVKSVLDEEEAKLENKPVISVSGKEGYYVTGGVAESSYEKIEEGMTAMVTSWNTGNVYEATITGVGNSPVEGMQSSENANLSYYPFTAVIEGDAELSPGEGVSISIDGLSGDGEDAIYLEQMFIREDGNRSYVYKKGDNGKLQKQYVELGKNMYGSIEIVSGLTMEDEIAFPYGRNVKEGAKTKTVESLYDYN